MNPFRETFNDKNLAQSDLVIRTENNTVQSLQRLMSPHVRESGFQNPGNFWFWNPESWASQSCNLEYSNEIGIRSSSPTDKKGSAETSTWNPESTEWTVLDSLTWGELMAWTVDDPRFTANYDLTHCFLQFIQINTISNFPFSKYNFFLKCACVQRDRSNSQSLSDISFKVT